MSFFDRGRSCYSRKLICVAYASAAAASLPGQIKQVQAAVFEQTCNDKVVVFVGGAPVGAPPQEYSHTVAAHETTPSSVIEFGASVPVGETTAVDVNFPAFRCASAEGSPSKGVLAMRAIQGNLSLPAPKRLSQVLNDNQLQMRNLAAKVGSQFADAPGVRKARLDEPSFIKLFTTLVHKESNFKPRAVSPAGAQGLGQLMPSTARDLGVKDTFAPEENLVGAATYLTDMLGQFGSPELALAAYNAGPTAVAKHGGIPPYKETRQYVADIFHEVLREPVSPRRVEELNDVARRGLAAFAAESRASVTDEEPFTKVLAENAQRETDNSEPGLLASAGNAAPVMSSSFSLVPRVDGSTSPDDNVDAEPGKVAGADEKQNSVTQAVTLRSPDIGTLPEPREFGHALSKSQLAMRELAIDTGLRHSKAPGVSAAGLSEEAFVTLFVALIRRESSFNSRAVSPDGAKGLGQLMPKTVRALRLKNPFAPKENLEAAASRLTRLLDQFHSPALALAAYNAGENAIVDRTAIPNTRSTRQLVADVLHDLESDPRPDFVAARFQEMQRKDVAPIGRAPQDGKIGQEGRDVINVSGHLISAHGSGAPLSQTPSLVGTTFLADLLSAIGRIVGEVTGFLQSFFSGSWDWLSNGQVGPAQKKLLLALPYSQDRPLGQETLAMPLETKSVGSGVAPYVAWLVDAPPPANAISRAGLGIPQIETRQRSHEREGKAS